MKIVFLDAGTLGETTSLKPIENLGDFISFSQTSIDQIKQRVHEADVIITNKVVINKEILEEALSLKLVVSAATGTNHIDIESCKERGIAVKNVADYSTESVAQHTFAMLFHLMHANEYFQNYTKNCEWEASPFFTHLGRTFFEIKGKTWGIIGLGTIGNRVATLAQAFGAKIIYFSSSDKNRSTIYERVELDKLLSESDIVSIHSPLNEKTTNLINSKNLPLLKEGGVLLNLGRGGIINERDLVCEFNKRSFFVGLDVLENEPMTSSSEIKKILSSDRFFLTPHIAWSSNEARESLVNKICSNIEEFKNSLS